MADFPSIINDIRALPSAPAGTLGITENGHYDISNYKYIDVNVVDLPALDAPAGDAQVLAGYKAYNADGELIIGTIPIIGDASGVISVREGVVSIAPGYTTGGAVFIARSEQAKLASENIRNDVTILGVPGAWQGGDVLRRAEYFTF